MSLFCKELKNILVSFWIFTEKLSGVTIIHFVFVKRGDFDFVGIFSFLFLIRIQFLFKLYPNRPWMCERFCIIVFVFIVVVGCAETIISRCCISKLEAVFMSFLRFSRATCWIFCLAEVHAPSILWWLCLSQKGSSIEFILLRLIDTAGCWGLPIVFKQIRIEYPRFTRVRHTIALTLSHKWIFASKHRLIKGDCWKY